MNFQDELNNVVASIKGAQAAVLMGFDGIAIAEAKQTDRSMQDATVEYSRVLSEAIKIARANEHGPLQEMTLVTDRYRFVFRIVGEGYFLGLLLTDGATLGKGRFILRRMAPAVQAEL